MVDQGLRQIFEGLRRSYTMPLTPAQQSGLNRYLAEDNWTRYIPVYNSTEGQALGLWIVPSFRTYLVEAMEHEPASHGIRLVAVQKLAFTLDPLNFIC